MPVCQDARYLLALYSEDEDGNVTDRIEFAKGGDYGVGPGAVYTPPPPQKVARGADSAYRHGSDMVRARYDNSAVEIRDLTLKGTAEILAGRVQRVTTMLEKARLRQERGWGEKVYVERDWRYSTYYAWDVDPGPEYFYETVDILRKEVYRGEFVPPMEDVGDIIGRGVLAPCRLNLECYPFWQGRERNIIFKYDINNHLCDAYPPAYRNYVNIDGDDLPGDAPCLVRVRVTNETAGGGARSIRLLRMGIKRQYYPLSTHCCDSLTFQAEDGEFGAVDTDASLLTSADCSCGYGVRVTPSDTDNHVRVNWDITAATFPEGEYRCLLRVRNNASARTILAQFRYTFAAWEWLGDQVEVPTHTVAEFVMVDLGKISIPPVRMGGRTPNTYTLWIKLQSDAASGTIDLDYLLLLPIEGGLKLTRFKLYPYAPVANMFTYFVANITCEYNGFLEPPLTGLVDLAADRWYDSPEDDLGFAAYLEPGKDHCLVFSADEWDNTEQLSVNLLDTDMEITVDIIPQYLYIR